MLTSQPDPVLGSGCVLSRGMQISFSFYLAVGFPEARVLETPALLIFIPVEQLSRYWKGNRREDGRANKLCIAKFNFLWKSRF